MTSIRSAEQVAKLYGVNKSTIHRWYANGAFDPAPTVVPSPSGDRDRVLFDVSVVTKQFVIDTQLDKLSRERRRELRARLREFSRG